MQFAQSSMLQMLWGTVLLVLLLRWAWKRRERTLGRFAQKKLLPEVAGNSDPGKRFYKNVLVVLVFVFSVIALARPQWGFEWQEVRRKAIDIIVVVDVSKSMLTQDVKPNRLERTKLAVRDLVKQLNGDRIGLVAFAGDAFLLSPLTVDYNGFLLSLNNLKTQSVPRGGTNIAKALEVALDSYKDVPSKFKSIIVVTDGENLEGDPLAVARKAKDMGVKVFTIGIGTKEGELIQIRDNQGTPYFLKDNQGNFVKSRLNEKLLQDISLTTGGAYVKSSGAQFGLDLIYKRYLAQIEKRELESQMEKRYHERFQIPLAIAFVLLMVETCLTTRKRQ